MDMKITRPAWNRSISIKAWTKGQKNSIFTVVAPPKDEGNGTLKRGQEMWTYNPKVNRVIKLPPSMMSQSWMGSDFSNDDLAKSDSIVDDYTHKLTGTETHEGKEVYVIESTPKPAAAVVWGMQKLKIRQDNILLLEEYYDEERKLVKALEGSQIQTMGGKLFPKVWKMSRGSESGEHTTVTYREVRFDVEIPDRLFRETALTSAWR
jgi:outer membrane lipoprotein-sorting protein